MSRWPGRRKNGFLRVDKLPAKPRSGERYWLDAGQAERDFTHYLFRYPAKFHRPIVEWALKNHGNRKEPVLDPFAGSGTLNVEALISGRPSVGLDLDPLACFIARVKTTPLNPDRLDGSLERIKEKASKISRTETELERLIGSDISADAYKRNKPKTWVPEIPNIEHWFKRHVIIDLSRLLDLLRDGIHLPEREQNFFLACYAATIRRVSNADPAPVSGLEVTSVQATRNKTREINVVGEFLHKSRMAIHGMRELWNITRGKKHAVSTQIMCGDARDTETVIATNAPNLLPFSLVITSPPYCNAIEYGRRHKLEMYWLNLVPDSASHNTLSRSYIGYRNLAERRINRLRTFGIKRLDRVLARISDLGLARAISLERYFASMQKFLFELARVTKRNADVICVIGNSTCAGIEVPTATFVKDLALEHFLLRSEFAYAIQNHHMQYMLRNGRGIREEIVLHFRRR
jgi:hypothetical protein